MQLERGFSPGNMMEVRSMEKRCQSWSGSIPSGVEWRTVHVDYKGIRFYSVWFSPRATFSCDGTFQTLYIHLLGNIDNLCETYVMCRWSVLFHFIKIPTLMLLACLLQRRENYCIHSWLRPEIICWSCRTYYLQ